MSVQLQALVLLLLFTRATAWTAAWRPAPTAPTVSASPTLNVFDPQKVSASPNDFGPPKVYASPNGTGSPNISTSPSLNDSDAVRAEDSCNATQEIYPGKISSTTMRNTSSTRPGNTSNFCDMFASSCCTVITEYQMRKVALRWDGVGLVSYGHAITTLDTSLLHPHFIPPPVFSAVKSSVDYSLELNIRSLTRLHLSRSTALTCNKNTPETRSQYKMIARHMGPTISKIAETLAAVVRGINTLKGAYTAVLEYSLPDACTRELIRNGVPTTSNLQNTNCQVCTNDTAGSSTCLNTCTMVVSGCYSQFITLDQLLPRLLQTLDGLYSRLQLQLQEEYTSQLKFLATAYPECFQSQEGGEGPGNVADEQDVGDMAPQEYESYFSETLQLAPARLEAGLQHACSGSSSSNTDCFTSAGVTAADSTPVLEFTTEAQQRNTLLPLGAPSREVGAVEDEVKTVIREIAKFAGDDFVVPIPPEEGSVMQPGDSGARGAGVWGIAGVGLVLWSMFAW